MNKIKKFSKFLWNNLYNKRSVMVVNLYNLIGTCWFIYLWIAMLNYTGTGGLFFVFLIYWTLYLNITVYIICHTTFIIQNKKNHTIKDNPVISSSPYRVICILSFFIVCINYLLGIGLVLCGLPFILS